MGMIRGRVRHKEWTKFENGRPVCGVSFRGYWTNKVTVGGDLPYYEGEDGEWYNKETGEKAARLTLNLLKLARTKKLSK